MAVPPSNTLPHSNSVSKRPGGRILGVIAGALTACALIDCLLQALVTAQYDGLFPIPQIVAFGPWFGLMAVLAALCALYSRRRLVLILALACALYQAWWCAGYWIGAPSAHAEQPVHSSATETDPACLRVMTLNCYFGNASAQQIVDTVDQEGVELLCLQEVTENLYTALEEAGLDERLPYWCGAVTGNQIWSSVPLDNPVSDAAGYSGSSMPAATLHLPWGSLRFVSIHTCAPMPGLEHYWDESLYKVAHLSDYDTEADHASYILMGDFNATIEHASFQAILEQGFVDGALKAGEGLVFTWPMNKGIPALVTLDHILLSGQVVAHDFAYATIAGSDHRAVIATIEEADV